jgi:hypothetical protein
MTVPGILETADAKQLLSQSVRFRVPGMCKQSRKFEKYVKCFSSRIFYNNLKQVIEQVSAEVEM